MLLNSLLNTTVVAFKILPLGSYAPLPAPSPPFKTILELVLWNGLPVAYPGIFFRGGGGGFNKFSLGQRERDLGGSSPLVRGSGGSCNLVQEISFHMVKFS